MPIRLRRVGNAPLRLDGNLTLYLSRYLHLVVDLTIESEQAQSGGRDNDGVRYYGDRRSSRNYGYGYEQETTTIKYNISGTVSSGTASCAITIIPDSAC